jgi:hypothetical protein
MSKNEYYVERGDLNGLWCVFHDTKRLGYAFSSWDTKEQAEAEAKRLNEESANDEH